MQKRAFCVCISACMVVLAFTVAIVAAEEETMTLAVHDYAPYYNSEGKGMMIDVYQAACDAAGIEVDFKVLPVKRAVAYLLENKVDAFSPGNLFMSPEQLKDCSMVKTFNVLGVFLYHDPDHTKKVVFNSMADLKGKKLAIVVNSPLIPYYQQNELTYTEIENPENLVKMLEAGRFEFVEGTLLTGMALTHQLFKDRMKEFNFVVNIPLECALTFNNANPRTKTLMPKFVKGFEAIKKNGEYVRILETYWGKGNVQKEALPPDLAKFGTKKASLEAFSKYDREPWGKIK